jgi:hypothetical protein
MPRRTAVLGFSVPPNVAADYERLAKKERTTKSELFRRMVEAYRAKLEEEEFFQLQRRMTRRARRRGVFTEKDVEKIVFEDR